MRNQLDLWANNNSRTRFFVYWSGFWSFYLSACLCWLSFPFFKANVHRRVIYSFCVFLMCDNKHSESGRCNWSSIFLVWLGCECLSVVCSKQRVDAATATRWLLIVVYYINSCLKSYIIWFFVRCSLRSVDCVFFRRVVFRDRTLLRGSSCVGVHWRWFRRSTRYLTLMQWINVIYFARNLNWPDHRPQRSESEKRRHESLSVIRYVVCYCVICAILLSNSPELVISARNFLLLR